MQASPSPASSTSSLVHQSGPVDFIHYGVGGAGNYRRAEPVPSAALPSSLPTMTRISGPFASGIGGAGNIHDASERAVISFQEELARSRTRDNSWPTGYFIGIGGAGNRRGSKRSRASSTYSSQASAYSDDPLPICGADMLWKKISKAFALGGLPRGHSGRQSLLDGTS